MVIPPNSLVAGLPGKVRRTLGDEDRKLILKYAQNYLDYVEIWKKEPHAPGDRVLEKRESGDGS